MNIWECTARGHRSKVGQFTRTEQIRVRFPLAPPIFMLKGRNGLNWLQVLWHGHIWFTLRYCWWPAIQGKRGWKTSYKAKVIYPEFKAKVTIKE